MPSRTRTALAAALAALLGVAALPAPAADEPPAAPSASTAPPTRAKGSWSAGLDAASLSILDEVVAPEPPEENLPAGEEPAEDRGEFFVVPIPRLDPALGAGLIGAAAYIFPLDPDDTESPPSIVGGAAFWMSGGSWGGGVGSKLYMKQDRYRLLTGLAYADLRYDLFVTPEVTGQERAIPLNQVIGGVVVHAQFRVAPSLYLGVRGLVGKITTTPRDADLPDLPEQIDEQLDGVFRLNGLGASFALDTRDSSYYPRRGVALDVSSDVYFSAIGSDVSYDRSEANYRQYATLREQDVLAWQAYVCAAGDDAPFFLQCQVGSKSILRGYSFGRYWDEAMAAVQAEYRWQVGRRWIVAFFGGVTQVAPTFGEFTRDGNLVAGGAGLRFVVEPKNGVTMRADYAWGEGERALYISVGEAF